MNIHMTFRHMETTEALKDRVNTCSERLKRFMGQDCELHWFLFVEADDHVAELRVAGPHIDQFAQSRTPILYQSIEETTDKMERMLRKQKEIVKDHLHRNNRASGSGT